jgi:hypothetical protein
VPFGFGLVGQDDYDIDEANFGDMSMPIRDVVGCCLLAAVQSFVKGDTNDSLDSIFHSKIWLFEVFVFGTRRQRPRGPTPITQENCSSLSRRKSRALRWMPMIVKCSTGKTTGTLQWNEH